LIGGTSSEAAVIEAPFHNHLKAIESGTLLYEE